MLSEGHGQKLTETALFGAQSGVRACHSSLGGEGGARRNEGSNDKAEKVAQSNAKMATRRPPSREGCILTAASCGIEPNLTYMAMNCKTDW